MIATFKTIKSKKNATLYSTLRAITQTTQHLACTEKKNEETLGNLPTSRKPTMRKMKLQQWHNQPRKMMMKTE